MALVSLEEFLDLIHAELESRTPDELDLGDPLSEAGGSSLRAWLATDGLGLRVLGQVLELQGTAAATVTVTDAAGSPFDQHDVVTAPQGHQLVELEITADGAGDVTAQVPADAVRLRLSAGCESGLRLRSVVAIPDDSTVREALRELLTRAALVGAAGGSPPAAGEGHAVDATFNLDLGLGAKLGTRFPCQWSPFGSISEPLQVRFETVLRAALGLELDDRMRLAVGTVDTLCPGWVRVHLRREHQSRLTLGATFALQLRYDLASPFHALLDEALEWRPFARLREAAEELTGVRELAAAAAAGNWETMRGLLSAHSAEVLADLLDTADLWTWLETDPRAGELFEAAQTLVAVYDHYLSDGFLASLWDRLLGRVELQPGSELRRALETIALLDPDDLGANLQRLLAEPWRHAVTLLEVLSGIDLEGLLIGDETARAALTTAAERAASALDFLDNLPTFVQERLRGFAWRTGISKVVAQLRTLAGPEALRSTAHSAAARLAERLLGRALEALDEDDLARIRQWASELSTVLEAASLNPIDVALRARLDELEGEAGFSVGIELDRLSRSTALLDLEVAAELYPSVTRQLAAGSLSGVLEAAFAADERDDSEPPFLLRDCVFTSRRARTSAVNVLLSLIGWSRSRRRRVRESWLRVEQLEGGRVERRARHSGALVVFEKDADRTSFEAGTWLSLRCSAEDDELDLEAAYAAIDSELRLSITRRDPKTSAEELVAVDGLLFDLGFLPAPDVAAGCLGFGLAPGSPTRLGITLRLGDEAVRSLLGELDDEEGWEVDLLNAAHRWFNEPLIPGHVPHSGVRRGQALSMVVASEPYRHDWRTRTRPELERRYRNGFIVTTSGPGGAERCRLAPLTRYPALLALHTVRREVPGALAEVAELLARSAPPTPDATQRAATGFATAMRRLHPSGWANPMFPCWLVIARLTRIAPEALGTVQGTASLRWQSEDEWYSPVLLKLDSGLPHHPLGEGIFPLRCQ